jgi:hypothetical protein
MLNLYAIFHLNLSYSSIEEEQRPEVIKKCYWPLLYLMEELDLKLNIEASGYTLETIKHIEPGWLSKLKGLMAKGKCEFIGSGYMQLIGPLVPAEVNTYNQQFGMSVYEKLLGTRPNIAMINEQAYSSGLVRHYLDVGYQAIIMEWNNPSRFHPEWEKELQYLPQIARGLGSDRITLIWNNAIAFQKFQRYAHGELELDEYKDYLNQLITDKPRVLSLYANDAEIFDYRPGRYHTEAALHDGREWSRIKKLFKTLKADDRLNIVLLSSVLDLMREQMAGNVLQLESPEQPIPVKKQNKYCISRWAVTGRADPLINTDCFRIYKTLVELERNRSLKENEKDRLWKELCYLWGSDFRTHITAKRFDDYLKRLSNNKEEVRLLHEHALNKTGNIDLSCSPENSGSSKIPARAGGNNALCQKNNHMLLIETESLGVRLNCRRGLAFDTVTFKSVSDTPLIGTLHHGFYEDISLGADFYTGHLIVEMQGRPKVTDLNPVEPQIQDSHYCIRISGVIQTELGEISKTVYVFHEQPKISIQYDIKWREMPFASIKAGIITLIPGSYNNDRLFYRTLNGGYEAETFHLKGHQVSHEKPVSHLISLGQCVGATNEWIETGDEKVLIQVSSDKSKFYTVPLIQYREVDDTFFCRILHSLAEIDETRGKRMSLDAGLSFHVEITARSADGKYRS